MSMETVILLVLVYIGLMTLILALLASAKRGEQAAMYHAKRPAGQAAPPRRSLSTPRCGDCALGANGVDISPVQA